MITNKDRKLLAHISEFGFITIEEARKIAFPTMKRGYEYARTRLQRLVKIEKELKIIYNTALRLNLFINIDTDTKNICNSIRRIYLMDFYCKMIENSVDVEKFEIDKQWSNGKYISSAFCVYQQGGHRFSNLIEVNINNKTLNFTGFDKSIDEIRKECNGLIPRLILIDDTIHHEYNTKLFPVIRLDYNLNNFNNIFI